MEYTFVLPVAFYRTSEREFVCESAFARHLLEMRDHIPPGFTSLRVCGPLMSEQDYRQIASHAGVIDEPLTGISLTGLNPVGASALQFWSRHAVSNFRKLWRVVRGAGLVHGGPSMNIFHPNEIAAMIFAKLQGRKTLAVVDIDIRKDAQRAFKLGLISRRRYAIERGLIDPLRSLQLRWVARNASLVLFKGQALVDDYGAGRAAVKNFFDTAHSASHVIPTEVMAQKTAHVLAAQGPLRCLYFGRLVRRKGVDLCIRSVVAARQTSGAEVSLSIVGDGEEKAALQALVAELGAESFVTFCPPVAFGLALFEILYGGDVLLAAPLTEDTPRSAFDAMASGMALCAYDTEYYRTLEKLGQAVTTTPWMSIDGMAARLTELARDRPRLALAQQDARRLALANTQESWLETRARWTQEFCG